MCKEKTAEHWKVLSGRWNRNSRQSRVTLTTGWLRVCEKPLHLLRRVPTHPPSPQGGWGWKIFVIFLLQKVPTTPLTTGWLRVEKKEGVFLVLDQASSKISCCHNILAAGVHGMGRIYRPPCCLTWERHLQPAVSSGCLSQWRRTVSLRIYQSWCGVSREGGKDLEGNAKKIVELV